MPYATHLTMRLREDRVLAPGVPALRTVVQAVLALGREAPLASFGIADTHLHAILAWDSPPALAWARKLEISLQRRLLPGTRFEPARPWPVRDLHHLHRAVLYALRQGEHHGIQGETHRESSALPDLLGLRLPGSYLVDNLRRLLPRFDTPALWDLWGADAPKGVAVGDDRLPALLDAAAAAVCLSEVRTSRTPDAVLARAAAIQVAGRGRTVEDVARRMEVPQRTVERLRTVEVPEGLTRAVEGWILAIEAGPTKEKAATSAGR